MKKWLLALLCVLCIPGASQAGYDGSGNYTLPPSLPQSGQLARAAQLNTIFNDIAAALTTAYHVAGTPNTNASLLSSGTLPGAREPAYTGDCSSTVGGTLLTCVSTNGVNFAPSATTDTTSVANVKNGGTALLAAANTWSGANAFNSAPTVGGNSIATITTGTFTGTLTGFSGTAPSGTWTYTIVGNTATVTAYSTGTLTGTSNLTTMFLTGAPNALCPATLNPTVPVAYVIDTGNDYAGGMSISNGSGCQFVFRALISGGLGFTASGTKGISAGLSFTYSLQ